MAKVMYNGRTRKLYDGSRGGHYVISSGRKVYLKVKGAKKKAVAKRKPVAKCKPPTKKPATKKPATKKPAKKKPAKKKPAKKKPAKKKPGPKKKSTSGLRMPRMSNLKKFKLFGGVFSSEKNINDFRKRIAKNEVPRDELRTISKSYSELQESLVAGRNANYNEYIRLEEEEAKWYKEWEDEKKKADEWYEERVQGIEDEADKWYEEREEEEAKWYKEWEDEKEKVDKWNDERLREMEDKKRLHEERLPEITNLVASLKARSNIQQAKLKELSPMGTTSYKGFQLPAHLLGIY
jgi:hypothetical protein